MIHWGKKKVFQAVQNFGSGDGGPIKKDGHAPALEREENLHRKERRTEHCSYQEPVRGKAYLSEGRRTRRGIVSGQGKKKGGEKSSTFVHAKRRWPSWERGSGGK